MQPSEYPYVMKSSWDKYIDFFSPALAPTLPVPTQMHALLIMLVLIGQMILQECF